MSAFIRKNPRLSSILSTEEAGPKQKADSAALSVLPGTASASRGASCVLTSTGNSGLDALLGDGLPLGCILTVYEDYSTNNMSGPASRQSNYTWSAVSRSFLAEGLAVMSTDWSRSNTGWLGVVSDRARHETAASVWSSLPKKESKHKPATDKNTAEDIKIAWRYQDMKTFDQRPGNELHGQPGLGHEFDLGRKFGVDAVKPLLQQMANFIIDPSTCADGHECIYDNLFAELKRRIEANHTKGLGRLVIDGFASPGAYLCNKHQLACCGQSLFVLRLSRLIENLPVVVLLTVPHAFLAAEVVGTSKARHYPHWMKAVEHYSDAVLELLAFPARYGEYDGNVIIHKPLKRHFSFKPAILDTNSLAFKLRLRHFVIEKFHLPPEMESVDKSVPTFGCASSGSARTGKLDF